MIFVSLAMLSLPFLGKRFPENYFLHDRIDFTPHYTTPMPPTIIIGSTWDDKFVHVLRHTKHKLYIYFAWQLQLKFWSGECLHVNKFIPHWFDDIPHCALSDWQQSFHYGESKLNESPGFCFFPFSFGFLKQMKGDSLHNTELLKQVG